jgi:hypothetical protein
MTQITGNRMIEAVQELLRDELAEAQRLRRNRISAELDSFLKEHKASNSEEELELLLRALRRGDDKAIEQIRQLSTSFESMDSRTLQTEVLELTKKLSTIDSRLHQIKTRTAFINAVLRPFDSTFLKSLLADLSEREKVDATKRVEGLRKYRVDDADYLFWVNQVADLFQDLVVAKSSVALTREERMRGQISSNSSRIYYQTWTNHMKRIRRDLIKVADGKFLEKELTSQVAKFLGIEEVQLVDDRKLYGLKSQPDAIFKDKNTDQLISVNFARMTQQKLNRTGLPQRIGLENVSIELAITSKQNVDIKAKKTWPSISSFRDTFPKWFDSLKLLWAEEKDFSVVISTNLTSGKSEINFPIANLEFADEKIEQAVELQF